MKSKKKESRNLNLAFYFGSLVVLIIIISLVFKSVDIVRKSRFDGDSRFTVAVQSSKNTDIISISPQEGTLTTLRLENSSEQSILNTIGVPTDGYVKTNSDLKSQAKSYFPKLILKRRSIQTNLTILDLVKLSIYSIGIKQEKVKEEKLGVGDERLQAFASSLFVDPKISSDKVSIQITNATDVPGLGNKLAKYITNLGGNVVLVNSSKDTKSKSEIIYENEDYTARKLKKLLSISGLKKDMNSISDILIIIGKDKEGF